MEKKEEYKSFKLKNRMVKKMPKPAFHVYVTKAKWANWRCQTMIFDCNVPNAVTQ